MKKSFTLLTILLFFICMSTFSQTKLNHIAVYVQDLKASAEFYGDFLALQEIEEPFKDGLHVWYSIGDSQLHLIEQQPWEIPTINKINHLCFSMEDFDGFIEKLKEHDISFEDWPGEKGKINIRPDGIRQIYIQDPNGYWIEVNDEHN
ncbi:VOC family protein [Echinicola rosea]|nr:VOC family protein [Echinicola rosea]